MSNRSGATRGWLVVAIAAVATAALAWFLAAPRLFPPAAAPPADAPALPAAEDVAALPSGDAEPEATPAGSTLAVWEASDGTLHVGDDPPSDSHELGKVTASDARVIAAARTNAAVPPRESDDLEEVMRRIRVDTGRRNLVDASGDPTWSVRDIEGMVATRSALDVATHWVTNPTMIRVAQRLCRYLGAQGDAFEPRTVVVRGRQGRILARCGAVG